MRLMFINPPSPDGKTYYRDTNRSGRTSKAGEIWPQAGLALFAGLYPDHQVKIIDCIAERMPYSQLFVEMKLFRPDWVVFNPVSCTITSDMAVAYMAKQLGAKTAAISPHLKALEGESHNRFPLVDHFVHHQKFGPEAEYQLREIITKEKAEGTSFADMPAARQDLLPISKYSMPFIGKNYTAIIASRGCPYACIYCRTTVVTERKARFRKVESIIEEIKRYRLSNFILHADTTTVNHKWLLELCAALRKLPFKARIVSNSRVDTVTPEILKEMKSAGWWMVAYGFESGNNKVLEMNQKEATVEQAIQAAQWTKEAGLKLWGYFMLGLYGDGRESMRQTIELSKRLPCDIVNFSVAAPYFGTRWGEIAKEKEWLMDQRWETFDQNYSAIVSQPSCNPDDVRLAQATAYKEWYLSWRGVHFFLNGFRPSYFTFFAKSIWSHLN